MAETFTITGSVDIDLDKVLSGLERLDKKVDDSGDKSTTLQEKFKSAGEKLTSVFKTVAKGAAVLGAAFTGLVMQGSKYDGEVQQTSFLLNRLNKTTQDLINTKSKEASKFAMTSKQYKDSATSMATFMQSMGMTNGEIDKLIPSMVQLTADGAAFANISVEESMEAIGSAAVGNYEALGKLNIEMSDALINNSSYAQNLGKTTQQMTAAEKTQAIYNTMLERGTHLTGFAESESGSFAAQLNLMKTRVGEAAGELGSIFLPMLTPVISKVGELAGKVANGTKEFKDIYEKTGSVKDGLQGALDKMGLPEWGDFVEQLADIRDRFAELPDKIRALEQPLTLAAIAVGTLTAALTAYKIQQNWFAITNAIGCASLYAWDFACGIATGATTILGAAVEFLMSPVTLTILAIGALIAIVYLLVKNWDTVSAWLIDTWNKISAAVSSIWGSIVEWFQALPDKLSAIFTKVYEWIKQKWDAISSYLANKVSEIVNRLVWNFTHLPEILQSIWEMITTKLGEAWDAISSYLSGKISSILSTIWEIINAIPGKIGELHGMILGYIILGLMAIWNFITVTVPAIVSDIITWFSTLPGRIWEWLTVTYNNFMAWLAQMYNLAVQKASEIINGMITYFQELPGRIWNWLVSTYNKVVTWGVETYNAAVQKASEIINGMITYFQTLPGRIWEWLVNTKNKVITWGSEMVAKAREEMGKFADAVINTVKDLPSKFLSLGEDIVKGVINGITGMKNWALSKVGDYFEGIVTGAKEVLGIASPSKVFRDEVGYWMAKGVGVGFEGQEKQIKLDVNKTLMNVVKYGGEEVQKVSVMDKITDLFGGLGQVVSATGTTQTIAPVVNFNGDINDPVENVRRLNNFLQTLGDEF